MHIGLNGADGGVVAEHSVSQGSGGTLGPCACWDGEEAGARHGNIASDVEEGGRAGGADSDSMGGGVDLEGGGASLIVEGDSADGIEVDEV